MTPRDPIDPIVKPSPVPWGRVTVLSDRVLIVAGGPSLRELDLNILRDPAFGQINIIAINRAIDWLPRVTSFFSVDPNAWLYAKLTEGGLRPGVAYYLAVPNDYGTPTARMVDHRVTPISGIIYLRRFLGPGPLSAKYGLTLASRGVNTGNSCYGALGLAYHMLPKKIAILGLDGTRAAYAYGPGAPSGSLQHLPRLFASATFDLERKKIQVVNGSPGSLITCFPIFRPKRALEWLVE